MTHTKDEVLRLADALEQATYLLSVERDNTAAELRRLHGENERLKAAQPAPVQEPEYVQLRHIDAEGDASPWGQPLDAKERHTKWAKGVEMRLLYTTPPAAPVPLTSEQQIAEALRQHGLTLVKTTTGYTALKLGQIDAHGITEKGQS
jgi:hypothetical protein